MAIMIVDELGASLKEAASRALSARKISSCSRRAKSATFQPRT